MCVNDRIISFNAWYAQKRSLVSTSASDTKEKNSSAIVSTPLMDLRSADDRAKRRLAFPNDTNFSVIPFPIECLKERSFELPARHVEFAILVRSSDLPKASSFLLGSTDNARKRAQKPWLVTNILIDDAGLWEQAEKLGLVRCDEEEVAYPLPRLWQPDKMVETVVLPLLMESLRSVEDPSYKQEGNMTKYDHAIESDYEVWDLASGAARDVTFLAEELKAAQVPFRRVVGIDHRYNAKEQGIVNAFWERRGVGKLTSCIKMDLSTLEKGAEELLKNRKVIALLAVRFWKPSLVEAIARNSSGSLKSGTIFAISHFCKPYDGAPWKFEHPTEKTVLQRSQLKELFETSKGEDDSATWEILYEEIAMDSDHGRTMIHFVARLR
ncbi:unnamed protein product [Cylindrotheca closterium]|uniref:Methyltransferase domain-containing protein n=1 Tax=Cylindrotheca closterium TaxID=2856 RepID=A0AAD2G074_9STRA|nr:unnamed protein product [Cylindrotheca closterium]